MPIPVFHPVLDGAFLSMYVMQLKKRDRLLAEIETAETEQKRKLLEDILAEGGGKVWWED